MSNLVKRSQLVVGKEYYFGAKRTSTGIFQGRENGLIYFTSTNKGDYNTVEQSFNTTNPYYSDKWKDSIHFRDSDELGKFEPVITDTHYV